MFLGVIVLLTLSLNVDCDEIYENSTDICKIRCTCKAFESVQQINCQNQNIQHMIANWPESNNQTVIRASFSGNNMTTLETLPPTDAEVEIVLSFCQIKFLNSGLFGNTLNIKVADLSHNLLTAEELSSDKFKGPYNHSQPEPIALERLDLSYNRIHTLNKNVFEHVPNLKILNLEGNGFKVLDVHTQLAIASLSNLHILNLANNKLTELEADAIRNCDKLVEIDLSKNDFDFVPESLVYVGKSLERLIIDDNPIIDFIADTFLGLENVLELSANNLTKLKYVNADTFVPTPKLKKLNLSNNLWLTDIDREAFKINNTLEEFYLNNNRLYKIDFKLLKWSQMRVFEFNDNPLECSCDLYNISQELPRSIKMNKEGPFCIDPRSNKAVEVFDLKTDICTGVKKRAAFSRQRLLRYHYSLPMAILGVILVFAISIALFLAYSKYRKFYRNKNYPFASQVLYNPLTTNGRF